MIGSFTKRRVPAYMGGLLLSLTAMLMILQAKKSFAPRFHEIDGTQAQTKLAPGATLKILFNEEPGYFLPPGFPTRVSVTKKNADGSVATLSRLSYRELTGGKEVTAAALNEAGEYMLEGEIHICQAPGVADCAKYVLKAPYLVDAAGALREGQISLNLPELAKYGLDAGASAGK